MSVSALTSYATTPRQYTTQTSTNRASEAAHARGAKANSGADAQVKLQDALPAGKFEELQSLRDQKTRLSNQLSKLQEQFSELKSGFGENAQNDIDSIVGIGRKMFGLIKNIRSVTDRVSDVLKDANPADAAGIARGKQNTLFDSHSMAADIEIADRMKGFMKDLFNAYQDTKSIAVENGEKDVLKSTSMKLADKFGARMVNWTEQHASIVRSAASNAQSLSILV